MMDWLALAYGLPSQFNFKATKGTGGGCMMGSASDAIFSVVVSARHKALKSMGCYPDKGEPQMHPGAALQKLVCYTSMEAHSCIQKAANLALVDIRILTPNDRYQITGDILEAAILDDVAKGLTPFLVIASVGTTGGVCFDELCTVGPIAKKYNMWMHIDAAYAGNAFILPELQHLKWGIEFGDSIDINPYKMINAALELSCLWIKDVETYKQPFIIDATYLIDEFDENDAELIERTNMIDYRHYGIPLSKRMRALKIWLLFRTYGVSGLRERVRNMINLAKYFEKLMRQDSRFEVTNIVELGVVCFRQKPNAESVVMDGIHGTAGGPTYCDEQNMNLLYRLNRSKQIHMCPCELKGVYCLRVSVNYAFATKDDIQRAWKLIQSMYVTRLDEDVSKTIEKDGMPNRSDSFNVSTSAFVKVVADADTETIKKYVCPNFFRFFFFFV